MLPRYVHEWWRGGSVNLVWRCGETSNGKRARQVHRLPDVCNELVFKYILGAPRRLKSEKNLGKLFQKGTRRSIWTCYCLRNRHAWIVAAMRPPLPFSLGSTRATIPEVSTRLWSWPEISLGITNLSSTCARAGSRRCATISRPVLLRLRITPSCHSLQPPWRNCTGRSTARRRARGRQELTSHCGLRDAGSGCRSTRSRRCMETQSYWYSAPQRRQTW